MTAQAPRGPVLLVANSDPVHLGAHLIGAARALGVPVHVCDTRDAFAGPAWRQKVEWWLRGHRPPALRAFSDHVVQTARTTGAACVLSTGIAPLDAAALQALGRLGLKRLNYLTDDPWNPQHRAPWFLQSLRHYDHVFTPRRANIADLDSWRGAGVSYLPFAYAPESHFPDPPATADERQRFRADLVFAGGADDDRVRAITPFIEAGLDVALYGGYWDRYVATRRHARGVLNAAELRKAIGGAELSLCLVRRANRDGHAMRTFEVAAMGGCMLVEDTQEHRQIFGIDGDAVVYFRTSEDAVTSARALLDDSVRRRALSERVRELVLHGGHSYTARLHEMTSFCAAADVA